MKRRYRIIAAMGCLVIAAVWWLSRTPAPTVLAFRLGQTFEQVVRNSTYPAMERSNKPAEDPGQHKFGAIWVTEPAVIVRFTDPKHGFTLPPTKFAVLTFSENQAVTLSTSPMLDPLPFDEAVAILENLQNQFKAGGWQPWEANDSTWFDLTPEGKKRLYARMFEPGYMEWTDLRVPKLYGMIFRLKCTEGCWTREPPYLFLIDIGVGDDHESDDPWRWARPGAAVPDSAGQDEAPLLPAAAKRDKLADLVEQASAARLACPRCRSQRPQRPGARPGTGKGPVTPEASLHPASSTLHANSVGKKRPGRSLVFSCQLTRSVRTYSLQRGRNGGTAGWSCSSRRATRSDDLRRTGW